MTHDIIVVKQLPLIEERLQQIKEKTEERVQAALALACTADTVKTVKEARASLNKDYEELERRRIDVKKQIMEPYNRFEDVYRQCVTDVFQPADETLKSRIDKVEESIKGEKAKEVRTYFDEYAAANGIDFLDFSRAGIKVAKTASLKSLKEQAAAYVDGVAQDLSLIDTYPENIRVEILVEYKRTLSVTQAVTDVAKRRKAVEEERAGGEQVKVYARQQAEAVQKVEEALPPPTAQPVEPEEPEQYETSFRVTGTMGQLKALKQFLTEGGYIYEQL